MLITVEATDGKRLVLDVVRLCYLGPDADMDMRFCDFVDGAVLRMANEEEAMYFAPQERRVQ